MQLVDLGLKTLYTVDEEARMFVRKLLALAFLPINEVEAGWQELLVELGGMPLLTRQSLHRLADYFDTQWMHGNVALERWNMHNVQRRTNNNIEGWHARMEKLVSKPHPNLHEFLNVLEEGAGVFRLSRSSNRGRANCQSTQ